MNIFFIHFDPTICAEWHVDKHVVKMILEYTQLLCTVWHEIDPEHTIFKPPCKATHKNHPCAIWTRTSSTNYEWLCSLGIALCKEYTYRYRKIHKCKQYFQMLQANVPPIQKGWNDPPQCMPDEYKASNSMIAYRNYYRDGKSHIHNWKLRDIPLFIKSKNSESTNTEICFLLRKLNSPLLNPISVDVVELMDYRDVAIMKRMLCVVNNKNT